MSKDDLSKWFKADLENSEIVFDPDELRNRMAILYRRNKPDPSSGLHGYVGQSVT